ncbi:beta-ketoacyl-[acyl-carrier-protein] synthase family protein, partial [bacterium]|nr:beta-ketoacyl-[acyl-carrier-protein] synthase family protein [bacterium]
MKQRQKRWVPITGIGALSCLGLDFGSTYAALFKERQLPTLPRRFKLGHKISYPVFELPPSKLDLSDPREPWLRTSRMAIAAATEALTDAGWNDLSELKHLKVGVCIGTTVGGSMNDEKFYRDFRDQKTPDMQPINRYLNSNPA